MEKWAAVKSRVALMSAKWLGHSISRTAGLQEGFCSAVVGTCQQCAKKRETTSQRLGVSFQDSLTDGARYHEVPEECSCVVYDEPCLFLDKQKRFSHFSKLFYTSCLIWTKLQCVFLCTPRGTFTYWSAKTLWPPTGDVKDIDFLFTISPWGGYY